MTRFLKNPWAITIISGIIVFLLSSIINSFIQDVNIIESIIYLFLSLYEVIKSIVLFKIPIWVILILIILIILFLKFALKTETNETHWRKYKTDIIDKWLFMWPAAYLFRL